MRVYPRAAGGRAGARAAGLGPEGRGAGKGGLLPLIISSAGARLPPLPTSGARETFFARCHRPEGSGLPGPESSTSEARGIHPTATVDGLCSLVPASPLSLRWEWANRPLDRLLDTRSPGSCKDRSSPAKSHMLGGKLDVGPKGPTQSVWATESTLF